MQLLVGDISKTAVLEFMEWRYEPPYHIYNMSQEGQTDYSDALSYFLNPEYEFHTLTNAENELVGFFSFGSDAQVPGGDYTAPALDIGLAVKPTLTGNGLGIHFAKTAVSYAIAHHQPPMLRVTIAEFNVRAQKVWQRLGFEQVGKFVEPTRKRPFLIFTKIVKQV